MDVEGDYLLPAAPDEVWRRLNDPNVLARCIPGCERMTRIDAEHFECEIAVSFGPWKACFLTALLLSNVRAPHAYTLTGRSHGGLAGMGEGVAEVVLAAAADGTQLRYSARLSAHGRLGKFGARWLSAATRRMTERFFDAFAASFNVADPA